MRFVPESLRSSRGIVYSGRWASLHHSTCVKELTWGSGRSYSPRATPTRKANIWAPKTTKIIGGSNHMAMAGECLTERASASLRSCLIHPGSLSIELQVSKDFVKIHWRGRPCHVSSASSAEQDPNFIILRASGVFWILCGTASLRLQGVFAASDHRNAEKSLPALDLKPLVPPNPCLSCSLKKYLFEQTTRRLPTESRCMLVRYQHRACARAAELPGDRKVCVKPTTSCKRQGVTVCTWQWLRFASERPRHMAAESCMHRGPMM